MKLTVDTADASVGSSDYVILGQSVEGLNCQQFAANTSSAKAITVQFWVRSNVTGTYICEIYSDLGANLSKSYTIDQADTWKKVVLVYTPPTNVTFSNDNGRGFLMQFWLLAGSAYSGGSALKTSWDSVNNTRAVGQTNFVAASGNEIYFTGVQVVAGNYPDGLPFEHRSYGEELALCQRYFQKHNWSNTKTLGQFHEPAQFIGPFYYPTTMRATPSFTGNSFGVGSSYVYSAGAYRGAPASFDHDSIKEGFCMLRLANGTLSGTTGVAGSMYGLVFSLDAEL